MEVYELWSIFNAKDPQSAEMIESEVELEGWAKYSKSSPGVDGFLIFSKDSVELVEGSVKEENEAKFLEVFPDNFRKRYIIVRARCLGMSDDGKVHITDARLVRSVDKKP